MRATGEVVSSPRAEHLVTIDSAVHAVGGGVLLVVMLAKIGEVTFKDGMELVATTGNAPVCRHGHDRDFHAHINIYGRDELPASDRELVYRSPHSMAHLPDSFSKLRSCDGAGDAPRSPVNLVQSDFQTVNEAVTI